MLETTRIHVTCLQTGGIHLEIRASHHSSSAFELEIYEQLLPYYSHLANASINIPVMSLPHFDTQVKGEWFAYYLIDLVLLFIMSCHGTARHGTARHGTARHGTA